MKILIAGGGGQLALALARRLRREHEIIALDRRALDIVDSDACQSVLGRVRPDVVVNGAAWTAVDRAESERTQAFAINAEGAGHLAQACRAHGAFLVHFSTDYVFDGDGHRPYVEDDPPAPQSVYGHSKLAGERAVADSGAAYMTLRLSWVYGNDGANFYKTMLRLAAERTEIGVVADQTGVPNYTADLADAVGCALSRPPAALAELGGLYHLSASGVTTWHDFARAIIAGAGFESRVAIRPLLTSEYPTAARRPAYSVLDGRRFCRAFGWAAPAWPSGLQRCLAARDAVR